MEKRKLLIILVIIILIYLLMKNRETPIIQQRSQIQEQPPPEPRIQNDNEINSVNNQVNIYLEELAKELSPIFQETSYFETGRSYDASGNLLSISIRPDHLTQQQLTGKTLLAPGNCFLHSVIDNQNPELWLYLQNWNIAIYLNFQNVMPLENADGKLYQKGEIIGHINKPEAVKIGIWLNSIPLDPAINRLLGNAILGQRLN